ncbi:glycoside hydrolase family 2 protein [Puia sp. P3]|uniref:glycoside hydrolase family 2 protein n=1 Tax=Puia sp. P3 TaxID=3423952 RepID=UPI003D67FE44
MNSFADRQGQGGDFRTYPSYPKSWETIKMGWLQKDFTIPSGWKGKKIQLYFEALAGDAEIIVNGKPAGNRFDIFLPFTIDITDLVNYGKPNQLRVGIRKPSLFDHRGSYGRRPYQAGSFWGQHIAGIWQDVYVEAIPPVHISNIYVQPLLDSNRLQAGITVTNETATTQTLTIGGDIYRWIAGTLPLPSTQLETTPTLSFPDQSITIPPHATTIQSLTITVNDRLQKWSPDNPALYGLVAHLSSGHPITGPTQTLDARYTRFGYRQTALKNNQFLLNNQPFTLKGDSWHFLGIPQMTRRYAWAWFTALRDAHLNAVRLHAQPYPSFYLDIADEMGIMVLDETAVWASDGGPKLDDPNFWQDTREQLQQQILRDRNHPSVFGWSVSNEVKPVIRNVMHGPQSMMDTLLNNFSLWSAICKKLDPSRPWVSADGEDDGDGRLPLYIVHYGGTDAMDRAHRTGKPRGVGEAGNAYYATPQQVAEINGSRAYQSFAGRMEGVATSSWSSLMAQRSRDAVYRSVFNLVWYGLQPLALGMNDTTKPPSADDGIFFTSYKEGPTRRPARTPRPLLHHPQPRLRPFVTVIPHLAPLQRHQRRLRPRPPDHRRHPTHTNRKIIQTLASNGTVLILGISPANLATINHLLPKPLTLTPRTASSLDLTTPDPITKNITAADLYFSELRPPEIITNTFDGPLVQTNTTILQASNTDWLKWNKQPEYAKTAMIIRSERETKPSGAALIRINNLLLSTLPYNPHLQKAQQLIDKLLTNLGALTDTATSTLLQPNGDLTPDLRHLQPTNTNGASTTPNAASAIPNGASTIPNQSSRASNLAWLDFWISSPRSLEDLLSEPDIPVVGLQLSDEIVKIDLNGHPLFPIDQKSPSGPQKPVNTAQALPIPNQKNFRYTLPTLPLQRGWNHIRILLQQTPDGWTFTGRLTCNQPEFLKTLSATMNKP